MSQHDKSPGTRHTGRDLLLGILFLFIFLAGLYAFRAPVLTGMADYLVVDQSPQAADMIFLLNGDYDTRPFRAAELYQQGYAPVIGIARVASHPAEDLGLVPGETDISISVMYKLGVPPESIILVPSGKGVTSTYEEAVALRQYVLEHDIQRVLLVTSAFHTRRSKWIFRKVLKGLPVEISVIAVPHEGFDETNWWTDEEGLIYLNKEYIKLVFYYFKYR